MSEKVELTNSQAVGGNQNLYIRQQDEYLLVFYKDASGVTVSAFTQVSSFSVPKKVQKVIQNTLVEIMVNG